MIYVGVHRTHNLQDGYMGSGSELKKAKRKNIERYGEHKFSKQIMEYFDSEEAMYQREAEIVTPEFCADPNTYNLVPGGRRGGYSNYYGRKSAKRALKTRKNVYTKTVSKPVVDSKPKSQWAFP